MTTWDYRRWLEGDEPDGEGRATPRRPAPGKVSLTSHLQRAVQRRTAPSPASRDGAEYLARPVQRRASSSEADQAWRAAFDFDFKPVQLAAAETSNASADAVLAAAARGIEAPSQSLPHLEQIQESFGKHNVSHVQAHVGGAAAEATAAMGADAYATRSHVAFANPPDLHTAAHEAAHIVQQQGGVQLKGGVGEAGDAYERHADAVADKVVAGESAEPLLDQLATGSRSSAPSTAIQRRADGRTERRPQPARPAADVVDELSWLLEELERAIKLRDYHAANIAMASTLELLPRVDDLLRPGPARSSADQDAISELRRLRMAFEALAPAAPLGGPPSDDERRSWLARTPVSLAPAPARSMPRSTPRSGTTAPGASSTGRAPVSGVAVRPDDPADRAHEEYLAAHWDRIRAAARAYFASQDIPTGSPRLAWGPDGARRAQRIVGSIFPTLRVSGHLEALVAPRSLDMALRLGRSVTARPGEGDADPTWNPNVGTAIARLLTERLAESMARMGPRYVAAYDRSGGAPSAVDLARSDAMDGVAAALLTHELVRVMGPLPRPARAAGARTPTKWRWLGERAPELWNWIEVIAPSDATADDVAALLPADVPPLVESDGRFFRMPEDWARTQPGAGEFAPESSAVARGTELAASPFALDAAIVQARDAPGVKAAGFDLAAVTAACAGHLGHVVALLGPQYAERVVPAYTLLGAARVASSRQQRDLARVLVSQQQLLVEVLQEIEIFHSVSYARGRTRGGAAIESVYLELALAAGNSHLYHAGRRHLAAARTKSAAVGKRLAEEALVASGAGADKLGAVGGAGAEDAQARQRDRFDRLDVDSPDPGEMEVDASIDAFVLQTLSLEHQLDTMTSALFATNDRLASPLAMRVVAHAAELGSAVSDVRDRAAAVRAWLVEKLATTQRPAARRALLERAQQSLGERITSTQVIELSHRVVAMLERVDDADRRIQIVNTALMALGISLVAAGAGAAVQAAFTTPRVAAATSAGVLTAGRVGAAAAGMVAETVVGAWLQTELLGDKPGEALVENALGWLMSVAALRGFHKVTERFGPFTAENLALWQQLGGTGARVALRTTHVTLEMALGAGAGYAAQRIVRSPVKPTEEEALEWAMQGASIVASRWIMTSLTASRARLEEARARVPAEAAARIDASLKDIDALHARAAVLADKPSDPAEILHVFGERQRLVGVEAAVSGTRGDPPDAPPGSREADEPRTRAEDRGGNTYAETVLTLAGLHQVAPGQWHGAEAAVRRVVANKRALALVEEASADGTTQWSVTSGGRKHTIKIGGGEGDVVPDRSRAPYEDPRVDAAAPRRPLDRRELIPHRKLDVKRSWKEVERAQKRGDASFAIGTKLKSADEGHAILARLSSGDITALEKVGISDFPRSMDPTGREWALIEVRDGFAIYAGGYRKVDLPADARVLGHTHPGPDPAVKDTDRGPAVDRRLNVDEDGRSLSELFDDLDNARGSGILPSAADINAISDGPPHVLYTRYVHVGDGKVANPLPGDTRPRVQMHMTDAKVVRWDPRRQSYYYEVRVTARDAAGKQLWSGKMYAAWHKPLRGGDTFVTRPALLDRVLSADWQVP